jgi:hypothetical protein
MKHRFSVASIAGLALVAASLAPAQSPGALNPLFQNGPLVQQVGGQDLAGNSYFGKNVFLEQLSYINNLTVGMPAAAAAAPTGAAAYTTGTVAIGTYYAKCVAVDWNGNVSLPSAESASVTTSALGNITWTCAAVTNAAYYQIWVGGTGAEANYIVTPMLSNIGVMTLPTASNTSGTINTVATSGPVTLNGPTVIAGPQTVTGTVTLNATLTGNGHRNVMSPSGTAVATTLVADQSTWTGTSPGPFVHVTGNTTALTVSSGGTVVAGQSYLLTFSVVAGGSGGVTPTVGGVQCGSAVTTTKTATCWVTASATTAASFAPGNTFTGSMTFISLVPQGPKATSCGTAVISQGSSDAAGVVSTAVSGCVLTFQNAYTNTPACVFTPYNAVTGDASLAATNTAITATATGMTSFAYSCAGLNE